MDKKKKRKDKKVLFLMSCSSIQGLTIIDKQGIICEDEKSLLILYHCILRLLRDKRRIIFFSKKCT